MKFARDYGDEFEDQAEDDVDVQFAPPLGRADWPPVTEWSDTEWSHWLRQKPGWTPDKVAQYLAVDRYECGVGLRRTKSEPTTWFYLPVPAAIPLHRSKTENVCYGGAVGGTKSYSSRWDAYRHLMSIPEWNSILMRRTHSELKRNHTNPAIGECSLINNFYGEKVMDLVPSEHELRCTKTNGMLTFGHCQNLGDEERYLGPSYDEFRPEEMATFHKDQIVGVQGRIRSAKHGDYGRIKGRMIGTTNPGGAQTLYIRDWFIDKNVRPEDNPKYDPRDYEFIPASLYDNPYYMDADGSYLTYEKRLFMYSRQRRRQLLNGDWTAITGQFFEEFEVPTKDRPYTRHVDILDIPPGCKIERWIDWGYSPNPGVCHWVACFPNGRLYVFAEWVFNGQGKQLLVAGKVADRIRRMTVDEIVPGTKGKLSKSIGDPSMWAKDGHTGESYEETFRRNGVRMIQADNDRVQGWGRFRHWLLRHPEGGSWLMYHPDCTYAIRTIPSLVHDETNPDDVDTTGEDHAGDADRYGVMGRPSPTKYIYRPTPSLPDSIAQMMSAMQHTGGRPFGKVM